MFVLDNFPGSTSYTWADTVGTVRGTGVIAAAADALDRHMHVHGYDPDEADKLMVCLLGHRRTEHSCTIYRRGRTYLGHEMIGRGSAGSVSTSLHVAARTALLRGASGVELAHNHPGGPAYPSDGDLDVIAYQAAALAQAGIYLLDHVVIGGANTFSMAAHRMPAHAWVHLAPRPSQSKAITTSHRPPLSDDDAQLVAEALRLVDQSDRSEACTNLEMLAELARAWMAPRTAGAIGVIVADIGHRPIHAEIVSDTCDVTSETLLRCARAAVIHAGTRAVLVLHSPLDAKDSPILLDAANELTLMLTNTYDIRVDAVQTGASGARVVLTNDQEKKLKVFDILEGLKRKKEKQHADASASLATIVRKAIASAELTQAESRLIESGEVSEAQILEGVDIVKRFDTMLDQAIARKRKVIEREPLIKAARERLPKLEREFIECRQLALASVVHPEYAPLASLASEHGDLIEFADEAAIRAHVEASASASIEPRAQGVA